MRLFPDLDPRRQRPGYLVPLDVARVLATSSTLTRPAPFESHLGSAQAKSVSSLTIPSLTLQVGDLLILDAAYLNDLGAPDGFTWNGIALTESVVASVLHVDTTIWWLRCAVGATADLVGNFTTAGSLTCCMLAAKMPNVPLSPLDKTAFGTGLAGIASAGPTAAATALRELGHVCFGANNAYNVGSVSWSGDVVGTEAFVGTSGGAASTNVGLWRSARGTINGGTFSSSGHATPSGDCGICVAGFKQN